MIIQQTDRCHEAYCDTAAYLDEVDHLLRVQRRGQQTVLLEKLNPLRWLGVEMFRAARQELRERQNNPVRVREGISQQDGRDR